MNGEALLLYDGDCRFCGRAVRLLRAWDRSGRIVALPYQGELVPRILPEVSRAALEGAMLFVGPRGRRYRGADGLPRILSLLPGGHPLRALIALPGLLALARRLYGWTGFHGRDPSGALSEESPA